MTEDRLVLAPAPLDQAVVVALGGNLPRPGETVQDRLEATLRRLDDLGLKVVRTSRWWRSRAWPDPADPPFLNGVAIVETGRGPEAAIALLHQVEAEFGRTRGPPNAPRTLDLDLIAHGRTVSHGALVLPHPRAHQRLFVMGPLAEIAPEWLHPTLGLSARTLAADAKVGADATPVGEKARLRDPGR